MTRLSATQQNALDFALAHGGTLVRLPGGFWTYPGCPIESRPWGDVPAEHVGTNTVKALVKRGVMSESEHRTSRNLAGRDYEWPVAVTVVRDESVTPAGAYIDPRRSE